MEDATSHEHPSQPSQLQSTGKLAALKSRAEVDQHNMEDVQKNDEQGTQKPVLDFRAQGLPHSEVKKAANAVARTTPYRVSSLPPYDLAKVNPY